MAASPQWLLRHHEVFSHFRPFSGPVPAYHAIDFLGTKIRGQFVAGLPTCSEVTHTDGFYPMFDEEYFEWIDVLQSVADAAGTYTMIELGAGFGRWAVRAAHAAAQRNSRLPCRLITVEADPVVFEWMGLHFADNGIDQSKHSLIRAAVSNENDGAMFYIGGPLGSQFDCRPDEWYGRSLTKDYDLAGKSEPAGKYKGFPVVRHQSGWRSIRVPSVTLSMLLKNLDCVDLVDMDIEGQELQAVWSSIEELDAKVKRLHIGTHGKEIESGLRQLLRAHRWRCEADYSVFSNGETPWGTIRFDNGVQSWRNPRL